MLQPPRRLSNATSTSAIAKPWDTSRMNYNAAGNSVNGGAPLPHSSANGGVGGGRDPSSRPIAIDEQFSRNSDLVTSPMHYHERDAPAASPSDAWRQTVVRPSVEALGAGADDAVVAAAAAGRTSSKPLVFTSAAAASPSAVNPSQHEGVPLAAAGDMRTVGAAGLFKVFRSHDQTEWWQTDNNKSNSNKSNNNTNTTQMPLNALVGTNGHAHTTRGAANQSGQHYESRLPFVTQTVPPAVRESALAAAGAIDRANNTSAAVQQGQEQQQQPFYQRPNATAAAAEGLAALPHSAHGSAAVAPEAPLPRTELLTGVLGQYEQQTAANGLLGYAATAAAIGKHLVADKAQRHGLFRGEDHNNTSMASRLGVSNINSTSTLPMNSNGAIDTPFNGFGVGNGRSLDLLGSPKPPPSSLSAAARRGLGGGASAAATASGTNITPPPPEPYTREGDGTFDHDDDHDERSARDDALALIRGTRHHQSNERALVVLQHQQQEIESLRNEAAQYRRQLEGSQRVVDRYEHMLGPLDQFTAQQVHLREEVVKLRDEVMRLVEKDGASQSRIQQLEAGLRRAGYGGGGGNTNDTAANNSSRNSGGSGGNNAFIAESQQRLEELQARLSRCLLMRTHIVSQLGEVEGLAKSYQSVDDGVSPVKRGEKESDGGDDHYNNPSAVPSRDDQRDLQKLALFDAPNQHTWRMRGKTAELELKLRTQDDLINQLNGAIAVQRETLASEQRKISDAASPPRSNTTRAASPATNNSNSNSTRNSNLNGGAAASSSNNTSAKQQHSSRNATVGSNLKAVAATNASLLAEVRPGAEAEIQRLLAVVNTKNEQILQMRQLLEAVAKSGRVGLRAGATADGLHDEQQQKAEDGDPSKLYIHQTSSNMRSLPAVDVHGQLLQAATAAADAKDGFTFMTNADGERARPSDILYPHQRVPANDNSSGGSSSVDHVALASQLWAMESENTQLNKRCTDLIMQVLEKNKRIAELEGIVVKAVAAAGAASAQTASSSTAAPAYVGPADFSVITPPRVHYSDAFDL